MMDKYTIEELEQSFHNYFKAKQKFLRVAKRYCEQQKVDEGQNGGLEKLENALAATETDDG